MGINIGQLTDVDLLKIAKAGVLNQALQAQEDSMTTTKEVGSMAMNDTIESIKPIIERNRDRAEADRRLPDEVFERVSPHRLAGGGRADLRWRGAAHVA